MFSQFGSNFRIVSEIVKEYISPVSPIPHKGDLGIFFFNRYKSFYNCLRKNNAGKAVFLSHSLSQEKTRLQGYNKRLKKSPHLATLRVVFF
jgi:hypothetical protein